MNCWRALAVNAQEFFFFFLILQRMPLKHASTVSHCGSALPWSSPPNGTFKIVLALPLFCSPKYYDRNCPGRVDRTASRPQGCERGPANLPLRVLRTQASSFLIKFIGVTLVNEIIWVSSVHFYDTWSVYCIVCPPPKVKSSSVTLYLAPFTLYYHSTRLPSGNHHTVVSVFSFLSHMWVISCGS